MLGLLLGELEVRASREDGEGGLDEAERNRMGKSKVIQVARRGAKGLDRYGWDANRSYLVG
jgi:glutamate synthase domain-containing protein 2